MSSFNLAALFETVVDAVPDREVLVVGERRLTYADLDERANRLADHLAARGIGFGDHVGLQLLNGTEYLEGMLACFKLRAVPINVNYRYVEAELSYLFQDAGLRALIHHRQFAPRVAAVLSDVGALEVLMHVEDGSDEVPIGSSVEYEAALLDAEGSRPTVEGRGGDDLYIVYTGGTTGRPKGVMWRHEDIFFAAMGGGDVARIDNFISAPEELATRVPEAPITALPTPPLMHASAHWLAFHQLFTGGRIVMPELGRFDPELIWKLVTDEQVFMVIIVGDAMARPLIDELAANGDRYVTDTLWVIGSGGAILSQSNRDRLLELLPNRLIADGYGSSETGTLGNRVGQGGATFVVNDQTAVLDEDGAPVPPGSDVAGRLARRGHIPLGYWGDEEKTAKTFVEVDGVRWVLPGDLARVEEDGTITLLGRGSTSINTGGEKVFPEEVEEALKAHGAIADAVVVGVPDERWGQRVVAVVENVAGRSATLAELQEHARAHLAGYKLPRSLVTVDRIVRSPAGKADYAWARQRAIDAVG